MREKENGGRLLLGAQVIRSVSILRELNDQNDLNGKKGQSDLFDLNDPYDLHGLCDLIE